MQNTRTLPRHDYWIFSTLSRLVEPVTPIGMPPVITIRSPGLANPSSLQSLAPVANSSYNDESAAV